MSGAPMPQAIDLDPARLLLRWPDGERALAAADLRAACRCADCRAAFLRGEPPGRDEGIRLRDAEPVGRYALRLVFSDGHARGIYPWALLRELGGIEGAGREARFAATAGAAANGVGGVTPPRQ